MGNSKCYSGKRLLEFSLGPLSRWICKVFLDGDGVETLCARAYQMKLDGQEETWSKVIILVLDKYEENHVEKMYRLYRRHLCHDRLQKTEDSVE